MPNKMSLTEMKEFVREHFEDFVNRKKSEVIHQNMTSDFYDHNGPGGKPCGIAGDEQMMLGMYRAMPDLKVFVEELVAEGDRVVCKNIWRWTDPNTHKNMEFHGFVMWRFENDLIAERWATVTPFAIDERTVWRKP
jgi:predicted ester cyclase